MIQSGVSYTLECVVPTALLPKRKKKLLDSELGLDIEQKSGTIMSFKESLRLIYILNRDRTYVRDYVPYDIRYMIADYMLNGYGLVRREGYGPCAQIAGLPCLHHPFLPGESWVSHLFPDEIQELLDIARCPRFVMWKCTHPDQQSA
jgi:hypothetical protein